MTKFDYMVLGASGMQGRIVSRDLLEKDKKVLLTDIYKEGSRKNLARFPKSDFRYLDVRNLRLMTQMIRKSGVDVVVNCAESDWNLNVHKACLAAGVNVVDLDSDIPTTYKQLQLDRQFKNKKLTAVTGCGSTPGINNVMLNYAQKQFDSIESVNAGFYWNSNMETFVPPFSIPSIVWEFTHPATVVEDGKILSREPLSKSIELHLRELGHQTGYLVEHAEIATFNHYFKQKGLKNIHFYAGFPPHSKKIFHFLVELGLSRLEKIPVDGGVKVAPLDLVNQVIKRIEYPKGYSEFENLWVEIIGQSDGKPKRIFMECVVPPLAGWEDAGCNIDTGFPASIVAQMIKDGRISAKGSFAPEGVVPEDEFFKELWKKGMTVYQDGVAVNGPRRQIEPKAAKTRQTEAYV